MAYSGNYKRDILTTINNMEHDLSVMKQKLSTYQSGTVNTSVPLEYNMSNEGFINVNHNRGNRTRGRGRGRVNTRQMRNEEYKQNDVQNYDRSRGRGRGRYQSREQRTVREQRPTQNKTDKSNTILLSSLLNNNEEVVLRVIVGKDTEGNHIYTSATAVFDGTNLTVTKCELVPSFVNTSSSKPGTLLYQFIDGLKDNGHLKRKFSVAPWKLCSVTRDGVSKSLEDIRTELANKSSDNL